MPLCAQDIYNVQVKSPAAKLQLLVSGGRYHHPQHWYGQDLEFAGRGQLYWLISCLFGNASQLNHTRFTPTEIITMARDSIVYLNELTGMFLHEMLAVIRKKVVPEVQQLLCL